MASAAAASAPSPAAASTSVVSVSNGLNGLTNLTQIHQQQPQVRLAHDVCVGWGEGGNRCSKKSAIHGSAKRWALVLVNFVPDGC